MKIQISEQLLVWFLALAAPSAFGLGGVPLWTNQYGGPYGDYDQPNALICDSSGNVIVTGYDTLSYGHTRIATIKYSATGVPLWTNTCGGNVGGSGYALAVDSQGRVFVAGASSFTNGFYYSVYTTLAYSSDGIPLWTNYYGYGLTANAPTAIVIDSNGHVVVTGYSVGGQSRYGYATVAYSSNGVPLWTNRYRGDYIVDLDAYARAIAADTNGNVFVTGYSYGWTSGYDYATLKYSPTGTLLWLNRYNGPANGNDYARALAVETDGTVFVTGYASNSISGYDYTTIAYSNAGMPLWTNVYDGPASGDDSARALALDHHGRVFVSGYSANPATGCDYATIAYTTAGAPLWTNRFDVLGGGNAVACGLAVDSVGNVFITGYCTNADTGYDYATVGYSSAGSPLWTNVFGAPGNWFDQAYAVATDPLGNVFVTGISLGSGQDYTTIKYSSSVPAPPVLGYQFSGDGLLLQWTNGLLLQSAPTVNGPFTNVPGASSPFPVSRSCPQQFFRLSGGGMP